MTARRRQDWRREALHVSEEAMSPPRVLVAEDDDALRGVLVEALEGEGYEVTEGGGGEELVASLTPPRGHVDGHFDLIVSDIRMPDMTGLEMLEILRDMGARIPVVLITAFGSAHDHEEAERLGALILDKPFEVEELLDAVIAQVPTHRYAEGWSRVRSSA